MDDILSCGLLCSTPLAKSRCCLLRKVPAGVCPQRKREPALRPSGPFSAGRYLPPNPGFAVRFQPKKRGSLPPSCRPARCRKTVSHLAHPQQFIPPPQNSLPVQRRSPKTHQGTCMCLCMKIVRVLACLCEHSGRRPSLPLPGLPRTPPGSIARYHTQSGTRQTAFISPAAHTLEEPLSGSTQRLRFLAAECDQSSPTRDGACSRPPELGPAGAPRDTCEASDRQLPSSHPTCRRLRLRARPGVAPLGRFDWSF